MFKQGYISILHMLGREDYTTTILKVFDLLTEAYDKKSRVEVQVFKSRLLQGQAKILTKKNKHFLESEIPQRKKQFWFKKI